MRGGTQWQARQRRLASRSRRGREASKIAGPRKLGAAQDSNAVVAASQLAADASDTSSTSICKAATKVSAGMENTPDNIANTARKPKVARRARMAYTAVLTTVSLGAMHTAPEQQVD